MRLFTMEIAPDERMIPVALTAAQEAARYFFEDETTVGHIALALEEAIANVTEYCLSDSIESIGVEAEVCDDAFAVTVTDKGVPGDLDKMLCGEKALGLSLMNDMVDRVSLENLGTAGRRQRLVKYFSQKPAFEVRSAAPAQSEAKNDAELTIRPLREAEAIEVARCLYDEFGFTYVNETVYYPERFWAAIQSGDIYSLIAVTESGEIAAHLAIWQWNELPGIWEMGMGVVKRQFRSAHIMERLTETILAHARDVMRLPGFLCEPVLYHPYTQKIANKSGFHACGAGLAYTPTSFQHTINNASKVRDSVGVAMILFQREPRTLYLPEEASHITADILSRMQLPATVMRDGGVPVLAQSETLCENYAALQLGRIVMYHAGKDAPEHIRRLTAELKRQNAAVIELFLPLNEPG
ncbi:MAG: ATP-binding protein, partial [Eubacteriales bacterium]|nr:ATP-binding protein [Eubacteriales bacterium]